MACVLVAGAGCGDGGSERGEPAATTITTSIPTAEDSVVTLTGQVTRSYGQHVAQLGTSPSAPVLVVFRTPSSFPNGARLEVSGTITTFSPPDLEAELGVDLGPDVDGLLGRTCLVATTVRQLDDSNEQGGR